MNRKTVSPIPRYPCGKVHKDHAKPREETAEQVLSLARWQREKLGATAETFRAQGWESPLGQMRLWAILADPGHGLSQHQHMALQRYIQERHLSRWAMGLGPEHPKSIAMEMVAQGLSLKDDPDEETVMKLRRNHNAAKSVLLQYQDRGVQWVSMLDKLARDEGDHPFWRAALGEVRGAANVLVRFYDIR